jgi:hypothetical protein
VARIIEEGMRHAFSLLVAGFIAALSSCSGTEGTPSTALDSPAPVVGTAYPRAEVERDLVLTLRQKTSGPFEVDRDPKLEVVLENHSPSRTYPIVMSSDGSEVGWREPHVFYTVDAAGSSGGWRKVKANPLMRCGLYAEDWTGDIVLLAPGERRVLPWFDFYSQWDLEGASRVRITAHYVYGDHAKDLRKVPPALHPMPQYALASTALELPVEEPLVLELKLSGPLPKVGEPFAPNVEVFAVNRSNRALPFATADQGATLSLEVEVDAHDNEPTRVSFDADGISGSALDTIAPGARRSVLSRTTKRHSWTLIPATMRPRRVRAVLRLSDGENQRVARSPWVTPGS